MLLVNKPSGPTSHDVVDEVRKITGEKRVGHAGTLDPFASGLLIVLIGREETKKQAKFLKLSKVYEAIFTLGEERDTDDVTGAVRPYTLSSAPIPPKARSGSLGQVLGLLCRMGALLIYSKRGLRTSYPRSSRRQKSLVPEGIFCRGGPSTSLRTGRVREPSGLSIPGSRDECSKPSLKEIKNVLKNFAGEIEQIPPEYSAVKIKGKKAYELARKGKKIELKPKKLTVHDIAILEYEYPNLKIRVKVSSGTYIRALARDIGRVLGTGAYVKELKRTEIGEYKLANALTLEKLKK